jgi:hypothetical protein
MEGSQPAQLVTGPKSACYPGCASLLYYVTHTLEKQSLCYLIHIDSRKHES